MSTTNTTNYALKKWNKGHPDWHVEQGTNADTIDAELKKHQDEEEAFKTNADLVAAGHEATGAYGSGLGAEAAGNIAAEQTAARGSAASLNGRISNALNPDGTLIGTTAAPGEWTNASMTSPAYTSARSFTLTGVDATGILTPGRPLKIDYSSSGDRFAHVKNATLSGGDTTVTIWDADEDVLNEAITNVYYNSQGQMNIGDRNADSFTPGSLPVDFFGIMAMGACTLYYYTAVLFSSPFDVDAGRATSNNGRIARVEFESGLKIGVTYASASGNMTTVEYRIMKNGSDTLTRTDAPSFDAGTNFVTAVSRGN